MKKALIYYNENLVTSVNFDLAIPQEEAKSYLLKLDEKLVAIVPFNYLIVIENEAIRN